MLYNSCFWRINYPTCVFHIFYHWVAVSREPFLCFLSSPDQVRTSVERRSERLIPRLNKLQPLPLACEPSIAGPRAICHPQPAQETSMSLPCHTAYLPCPTRVSARVSTHAQQRPPAPPFIAAAVPSGFGGKGPGRRASSTTASRGSCRPSPRLRAASSATSWLRWLEPSVFSRNAIG